MKCGLEIHQQLSTKKLFCDCESKLSEEVSGTVTRVLRPTQSEMGEIDRAALEESIKNRKFVYEITDNSCLVELDEEPPHDLNREALDVALQVALMLNARIIDEIHVMRKIVIDGSNTSGFQRTALVAVDGFVETSFGKVRIPTICLEEEAARKIEERENEVVYRLDRLGIPLIEITTEPAMRNGKEVREVAERIGAILRATKRVRRGVGTIRQDINISTGQGRVEIKGASKLNMIPRWVDAEIERQEMLKEISETLTRRDAHPEERIYDLTPIFQNTKSRIIVRELKKGGKVLGIKLVGFKGVLKSGRYRLGKELAERVRVLGIKGLFHGDELPAYGIESEVDKIKEIMNLGPNDSFVIIAAEENAGKTALQKVVERAKMALEGVPGETRAPKDDGSSTYLRPLPGAARMYPETDIPPIFIDEEYIKKIKSSLPKMPEERVKDLVSLGVSKQDAEQIVHMGMDDVCESLIKNFGYPTMVARVIINGCPELNYDTIFQKLKDGAFAKEALDDIVMRGCNGESVEKVISEYSSQVNLEEIISRVINEKRAFINERGMSAFKPLMGLVMKEVRGKVDGRVVSERLKKKLEEITKD